MAGHKTRVVLPPEIVAARRQRRARTLRLYALAVGAVLLLGLGILFSYGAFFSASVTTDARFSTAFNAASAALMVGNDRAAERDMRAALAIRDNYDVRYDLGIILLKEGKYAAALGQFRTAARFKQLSDAYWYAAIAALAVHRPDLARDQIQHALALDPSIGEYHATLAMVQQALGHRALAAREFALARHDGGYAGQTIWQWIARAQFEQTTLPPANGPANDG